MTAFVSGCAYAAPVGTPLDGEGWANIGWISDDGLTPADRDGGEPIRSLVTSATATFELKVLSSGAVQLRRIFGLPMPVSQRKRICRMHANYGRRRRR